MSPEQASSDNVDIKVVRTGSYEIDMAHLLNEGNEATCHVELSSALNPSPNDSPHCA